MRSDTLLLLIDAQPLSAYDQSSYLKETFTFAR